MFKYGPNLSFDHASARCKYLDNGFSQECVQALGPMKYPRYLADESIHLCFHPGHYYCYYYYYYDYYNYYYYYYYYYCCCYYYYHYYYYRKCSCVLLIVD